MMAKSGMPHLSVSLVVQPDAVVLVSCVWDGVFLDPLH
jgi:hypothetical protein